MARHSEGIALYVTGLFLLAVRQTQTRVGHFPPGRCHNPFKRLLWVMPLSARYLLGLLIGSLSLDTHYNAGWFTKRLQRLGIT